ncbi:MAG: YihA family ribosome biogenesis GTP-binding protein, partial [Verrucomicrobiota bacterium]
VNRPNLRGLFILIDSRIPPQKLDLEFTEWVVDCRIPFALIFTKTDKQKAGAIQKTIDAFKEALAERCDGTPVVLTCSAKLGKGRREILKFIQAAL